MPLPNSIDSTSSASSRALESWTDTICSNIIVVTKLRCSDTNCCVHNSEYHTCYDINSWEIRDPHWRPQACHEIDYLEHTRWILKNTRRRTHNLTCGPNLTYVHGERTWERFINKLDTKRSNLLLDDTRVFTFPLNLCLDYKSIPSLYSPSPCSSLSWLFRAFLAL